MDILSFIVGAVTLLVGVIFGFAMATHESRKKE